MSTVPNKEQIAALEIVGKKAADAVCNFLIRSDPSDVACLYAPVPNATEIVCPEADGKYDAWKHGRLTQPDLSADEAANIVIAEYKANKIDIIMCRLFGENWPGRKSEPEVAIALEEVTNAVMDINGERKRSDNAIFRLNFGLNDETARKLRFP
jgi:hypothetical protein